MDQFTEVQTSCPELGNVWQVGWQVGQGLLPENTPFPLLSLLPSYMFLQAAPRRQAASTGGRELKWLLKNFSSYFLFGSTAYGILVSQPGIELVAPCSQAES